MALASGAVFAEQGSAPLTLILYTSWAADPGFAAELADAQLGAKTNAGGLDPAFKRREWRVRSGQAVDCIGVGRTASL